MRTVPDDQVGTGIDCPAGKPDDIAARLAEIFFFGEWQVHVVCPFGTAVKRYDHDVVMRGTVCDRRKCRLIVEHHV